MRKLAVCALVLVASAANAGEREIRIQCGDGSQQEMLVCLKFRAKASEAFLQTQERHLTKRIALWDEGQPMRDRAAKAHQLAHDSFIAYRNSHCDLARMLGGGAIGSSPEARHLACLIDQNRQRSEMLVEKANELPGA